MTLSTIFILAAVLLMAVAGVSVFIAFQRPGFVAGLVKAGVSAFIRAVLPAILKRKSAEEEHKDHQDRREAVERNITGRPRDN